MHSLLTARLQSHSILTTTLEIRKLFSVADGEESMKVHIEESTTANLLSHRGAGGGGGDRRTCHSISLVALLGNYRGAVA